MTRAGREAVAVVVMITLSAAVARAADAPAAPPPAAAPPAAAPPAAAPPASAPPPAYAPYPPAAPYYPPPPGYGYPPPGYGYPPPGQVGQYLAYDSNKKNPMVAVLLECLVPGVGSIYADHIGGALITWAGTLAGLLIVFYAYDKMFEMLTQDGAETFDPQTELLVAGSVIALAARIFGVYDAYTSAGVYNEALAKRLGITPIALTVAPISTGRGHAWAPALTFRF